jgi:transcriptional regulator with AAA-type ATPase domain
MDDYDVSVPVLDLDNSDDNTVQQYHAELVDFLTKNPDMRKAAQHSLQQGLWAGGSAVAGGLLFGPVGGMVGGIAGSIIGLARSQEKGGYDGIVQQLGKLQAVRRNRLVTAVWNIVQQQQQPSTTTTSTTTSESSRSNNAATTTTTTIISPKRFRSVLVELAAQPRVREQIWKVCMDIANDNISSNNATASSDEYSSASATVLTSD